MNWEAIAAIGEIVGAIAVVVSLVYLALQIRTQNKQAKLTAIHEMSREHGIASETMATGSLSNIFVRANKDYQSITEAEAVQLVVFVTGLFRAWESAFLENRVDCFVRLLLADSRR
jgi:formate/nitrite transporter FocA (FNT family)